MTIIESCERSLASLSPYFKCPIKNNRCQSIPDRFVPTYFRTLDGWTIKVGGCVYRKIKIKKPYFTSLIIFRRRAILRHKKQHILTLFYLPSNTLLNASASKGAASTILKPLGSEPTTAPEADALLLGLSGPVDRHRWLAR